MAYNFQQQGVFQHPQGNPQVWGQRTPWYAVYFNMCSPQIAQQIYQWFYSIDTNRNGSLDINEVGRALQQAQMYYHPETVYKVMQVFDLERSGQLKPNEFVALYQFICTIRTSFVTFDRNRSGYLDWGELQQALQMNHIFLSPQALTGLMFKFDSKKSGKISLEDYTNLSIYLANLRTFFDNNNHKKNRFGQDTVTLSFDELVGAAPFFA